MNWSRFFLCLRTLLIVSGFLFLSRLGQAHLFSEASASIGIGPAPGDPPTAPTAPAVASSFAVEASCSQSNCNYLPAVSNDVGFSPLDRPTSLTLYQTLYLPGNNIASGWNGNVAGCVPGSTSAAFKDAILKRLNYFRLAAGIPALTGLNAEYNQKAQAAALMMSAQNALSHSPDTSWKCYTSDGREAAGRSNLFLGVSGPAAISGYVRDPGSNNQAAGHRRWILYPQTQQMGTGDIPPGSGSAQANALYVFDPHMWEARPATRNQFVSWPPAGFVPYNVVYARWSFAIPGANFTNASVSLSRNGVPVGVTRYPTVDGYGENTLVWIINGMGDWDDWAKPASDTTYTVNINGVVIDSQSRNFTYTVIIFDPGS